MERLIIEFNPQKSCEDDIDDMRELLEMLSKRYNFRWSAQVIKSKITK